MLDREKATEWLEFDYLPRVGAYRKDCEIGCDACMSKHNGDNYCDIDMLQKILALLKKQEMRIEKYEYLFHFLGIGFKEWTTKILNGEAEVICETDDHEHKTVITFKLI